MANKKNSQVLSNGEMVPIPSGMLPKELTLEIEKAVVSDKWMISVVHVSDGKIIHYRKTKNFPTADLEKAAAMITADAKKAKASAAKTK